MFVKVISLEGGTGTLYECVSVNWGAPQESGKSEVLTLTMSSPTEHFIQRPLYKKDMVYVMNSSGQTIDSFSVPQRER